MDYKRADTAVDSLTFSERLSEGGVGAAVGGLTRRQLLLAGGGAATAGVVIGATALSTNTRTEPDDGANTEGDAGAVTTAPIPDSPGNVRYAMMGSADADVTVTYFGSWKCPYCAQFSTGMLSQLVTDYVEPGTIALEFRNLAYFGGDPFLGPDAPTAGQAGLAVWNIDPASYWAFHEYVFRNQPPESDQWATAERLVEFAQAAGVSETASIRTAVQENQYDDALRATDSAASDVGVDATPTLLIDGTTVNPLGNEERTRQLIEDATGSN
ncbi:DsbA family protein [Haloarcula sp. S1AR25-5A]|uniref:DsbA family protein n=1 Tax=Haloarcula terrestris TaxID=2950533 RepID=A0AAE4JI42_9EURY|nr:DsbA family protein [Haloarcula terrestris]MDS0223443.1 DsbA family protein [Haloarcula terrestris]